MSCINNRVAVITGAGGVICSALAKALGERGAKVALLDRNRDKAQEVAREISAGGGTALVYEVDVLDRDSLRVAHSCILKDLGPCSLLVNGAGGNNPCANTDKEYYEAGDMDREVVSFFDLDPEGVEWVFNLNYLGTLLPTMEFARDMVDSSNQGCSIINISSMNAYRPLTKIPAYSGAKAAVSNLTQWLAVHFSKVGIRVNALAPGFFVTGQNERLLYNEDGSPTDRTRRILEATPMGRFGRVEELVGTLMFLAEEEASGFITGAVIPIDGGFSAYSGV